MVFTVLIADSDEENISIIRNEIEMSENFKLCAVTQNSREIIPLIREREPDILIVDFMLEGQHSINVLKNLRNEVDKRPLVIVTSALLSKIKIRTLCDIGVDYYLKKPIDPINLLSVAEKLAIVYSSIKNAADKVYRTSKCNMRIGEETILYSAKYSISDPDDIKRDITKILHELGVPANIIGHDYIRDALCMMIDEQDRKRLSLTKDVYPAIADTYNKNHNTIERAMRTAIEIAWTRGKPEVLDEIFGFTVSSQKGKPTNTEFLAMLLDRYKLKDNGEDKID